MTHCLGAERQAWIQVARGAVRVNDEALGARDGVAIASADGITLEGDEDAEVLLFDLATAAPGGWWPGRDPS